MEQNEHDSLLVLIRKARHEERSLLLQFKGGGQMVVLGKDQLFRQSGCSLDQLLAANPSNTRVKRLQDSSPAVVGTREKGRELGELQWMLAYELSAGRLLFDAKDTDVFKLERWPNFTRLPHTDNCLRMAALLTRRNTSVALVSTILKIPMEQVRQFYVASKEAGYSHAPTKKADAVEIKPKWDNPSLISSLLMKLRRA